MVLLFFCPEALSMKHNCKNPMFLQPYLFSILMVCGECPKQSYLLWLTLSDDSSSSFAKITLELDITWLGFKFPIKTPH
jgi:hypothetical protein